MMPNKYLLIGLLILLLAWAGPLPELAHSAFYGHMIMHMMVVALASPFIALGINGSKFDPTSTYPVLFAPIPAALGELLIVWLWHAPTLHHYARHERGGIFLEQGMFLLAGVWVWLSSFGSKAAGIIGLLLTSMHMTFLGVLLGLASHPLYSHHHGHGSLTALEDQQLGGAIMLVVGGLSYFSGGLWITYKLLKERRYEKMV